MLALRQCVGIAAIVALCVGANLFVFREQLFVAPVLAPLAVGGVLMLVWSALKAHSATRTDMGSGPLGVNAVIASVAFFGICTMLYAFVLRYDREWDLTQEGRRELAPQTVQVLETLVEEVSVYCFFVRSTDPLIDVSQDKTRRFLERCQAVAPQLTVSFIDPQREPEQVEALNVLRVSQVGTVVLRAGTRQREIPLSDATTRLEERDFTNALINVARESRPKVYFLTGHGEKSIEDDDPKKGASNFSLWLEKEAYEVDTFLMSINNPVVPADCAVLIINGYQDDLRAHEIQALDHYIEQGGRLLVLVDPQIALNNVQFTSEQIRPWLKRRFGIVVGSDIVVSQATEGYKALFVPDFAAMGDFADFVEPSAEYRGSFHALHPITRTLDIQVVLSLVRSVTLVEDGTEGAIGAILLRTTPDTWAEDDLGAVVKREPIRPDEHELKGPFGVAAVAVRKSTLELVEGGQTRESRVVVYGDSGFSTNEEIAHVGNQNLLLNTVAWLSENENLIAIRSSGKVEQPLVLTKREQHLVAWIAVLASVQAVGLVGLSVWVLRRRYR